MFSAADIRKNVIGGAVDAAFAESLHDTLPCAALHPKVAIRHVSGDVIAGGLKSKPESFLQRQRDEAERTPATDSELLLWRSRRAGHLVVLPLSLIDLDDGFEQWIVIAPIGAHLRRRSVRRRDAFILPQIAIEHLSVRRRLGWRIRSGLRKTRQRTDASLDENHVAVPFRIRDATLIGEHRNVGAGEIIRI